MWAESRKLTLRKASDSCSTMQRLHLRQSLPLVPESQGRMMGLLA